MSVDDGRVVNALTIRGRDQVMLKVTVASQPRDRRATREITTSSLTVSSGHFHPEFNPFGIQGTIAQIAAGVPPAPFDATTALTVHNPANTLTATLQAFERYGVTRILAEPTVTAVSGESAKLTVGGEIPIPGRANLRTELGMHQAAAPSSRILVSLCNSLPWFSPKAASCFILRPK